MGHLRAKRSAGEIRKENVALKRLLVYVGRRLGIAGKIDADQLIAAADHAAVIIMNARMAQRNDQVDTAALDAEIRRAAAESAVPA